MVPLRSSLISILAVATTLAYAQHTFKIVRPVDQEYLQIGGTFPVELQVSSTGARAHSRAEKPSTSIQLLLCTEITGLPLCNHTTGTVLVTAPFHPPSETYHVSIPPYQRPGLSRLLANITHVNGTVSWTSETTIEVYLGNRT